VLAYYSGPRVSDATQARIRQAVDRWTDVTSLDDRQAARRIVEDGVDILVDLNGYTKEARQPLLALRPAPVIVNWLGSPGSLGSPHHHYIVADEAVIPPALERYYAERVVRLPCYQPNDRRRVVAEAGPSRAEAGLPEAALVYCCFNGTQKITTPVLARWMRILGAVPHAVLWLLSGGEGTDARLR
jgi:predicted O-linked N-acetylglucosamine transferase (SPINDLY family)